jgi:3-phenylpropionate/trans-cinnamate dioxygenase ferredoxin subunit
MKRPVGKADLAEGELRGVAVGKRNLLLARDGGRVFALDDWCNHAGCLLSGGRIERARVICPCHEVGFELATGKVATQPVLCDDQTRFDVEERDGQLWVELPDDFG